MSKKKHKKFRVTAKPEKMQPGCATFCWKDNTQDLAEKKAFELKKTRKLPLIFQVVLACKTSLCSSGKIKLF
jgi:hypothetical protein